MSIFFLLLSQCPWDSWRTIFGVPNVEYCEEHLCSWIENPINGWSNIAYIIFGIITLRKSQNNVVAKILSYAMLAVGTFSFLFHVSHNLISQYFDFLGMYGFLIYYLLLRYSGLRRIHLKAATYLSLLMGLTHGLNLLGLPFQLVIVGLAFLVLIQERHFLKQSIDLQRGTVLILIAESCSLIDLRRVWCQPHSWIQGHAIWHVLSALSLYYLVQHLRKTLPTLTTP